MSMAAAGEAESAEAVMMMMRQMDSDDKVSRKKKKKKYIHDDLSFYILSKLPIKSLKRFRCVRKSWSILFENSHFMAMYRNHFISCNNDYDSHRTFLLLYVREMDNRYHAKLHLFPSTDQTFKNTLKLNLPPPFHDDDDDYLQILGSTSVNGILCIKQNRPGNNPSKVRFVLWNPATHEFVVVPPSPDESGIRPLSLYTEYEFNGFGYDKVRDDFKVFQYVTFYWDERYDTRIYRDPMFVIYSLRTNSWRIVDIDMPYACIFTVREEAHGVYLDGMCHWLVSQWNVSLAGRELLLLSFDLSDEVLFVTPMDEKHFFEEPMDENSDHPLCSTLYHLVVLNESIAMITNHDTTLQISILGELGVKESWIKLFIIGLTPSFDWRPIGVGKKGYIFFRKKDDELAWVDLRTQQIEEIGAKAEECCCVIGIYKESLLPIVGLNN